MKNDDGALSFGTAIDMSGFDAGIEQIEGKVAGLTSNVEVETSKISQLLANVPTLNIEVVTNASQSLSTIDTAYAELDRVIDTNRSSVLALEEQYLQLPFQLWDVLHRLRIFLLGQFLHLRIRHQLSSLVPGL